MSFDGNGYFIPDPNGDIPFEPLEGSFDLDAPVPEDFDYLSEKEIEESNFSMNSPTAPLSSLEIEMIRFGIDPQIASLSGLMESFRHVDCTGPMDELRPVEFPGPTGNVSHSGMSTTNIRGVSASDSGATSPSASEVGLAEAAQLAERFLNRQSESEGDGSSPRAQSRQSELEAAEDFNTLSEVARGKQRADDSSSGGMSSFPPLDRDLPEHPRLEELGDVMQYESPAPSGLSEVARGKQRADHWASKSPASLHGNGEYEADSNSDSDSDSGTSGLFAISVERRSEVESRGRSATLVQHAHWAKDSKWNGVASVLGSKFMTSSIDDGEYSEGVDDPSDYSELMETEETDFLNPRQVVEARRLNFTTDIPRRDQSRARPESLGSYTIDRGNVYTKYDTELRSHITSVPIDLSFPELDFNVWSDEKYRRETLPVVEIRLDADNNAVHRAGLSGGADVLAIPSNTISVSSNSLSLMPSLSAPSSATASTSGSASSVPLASDTAAAPSSTSSSSSDLQSRSRPAPAPAPTPTLVSDSGSASVFSSFLAAIFGGSGSSRSTDTTATSAAVTQFQEVVSGGNGPQEIGGAESPLPAPRGSYASAVKGSSKGG